MYIPEELQGVLSQNLEVMGGEICFTGTRIPVQILFDNRLDWISLAEFFDCYPDLDVEQVQAVVDWEDRQARRVLGIK